MCRIINSRCVDLKNGVYFMVFWCDDIDNVEVPEQMTLAGGSIAVETTSEAVTYYIYNEDSGDWVAS